jgi:hypothetical protein
MDAGRVAMVRKDFAAAHAAFAAAASAAAADGGAGGVSAATAHSNAAIAAYSAERWADALASADAAIALDAGAVKPRATRAAALDRLGRDADAEAAYEAVLALAPGHATTVTNLAKLRARRAAPARGAGAGAGAGGAGFDGFPPAGPLVPPPPAPASLFSARPLEAALLLARLALVALAVAYVLPIGDASYRAYYAGLLLAAATHVGGVVAKHGAPTWARKMEWVQAVLTDASAPSLLLPLVFYSARPVPFGPAATMLVDGFLAAEWVAAAAARAVPAAKPAVAAAGTAVSAAVLRRPADAVGRMRPAEYRAAMVEWALRSEAYVEVLTAVVFAAELALPSRALMATVMLWQGLQQRYIFSPYTRAAFASVDGTILAVTGHRLCPGLVRGAYGWVRSTLHGQVMSALNGARERAGGGGGGGGAGGALSRCAVM